MQRTTNRLFGIFFVSIVLLSITESAHARVFHAGLGRFTTRDPLGYVDGSNLYEYVRSNPVANSDPSGTDCPGCDGIWDPLETDCMKRCCAVHDLCYCVYGCTAGFSLDPDCEQCEVDVVECMVCCLDDDCAATAGFLYFSCCWGIGFNDPNDPGIPPDVDIMNDCTPNCPPGSPGGPPPPPPPPPWYPPTIQPVPGDPWAPAPIYF